MNQDALTKYIYIQKRLEEDSEVKSLLSKNKELSSQLREITSNLRTNREKHTAILATIGDDFMDMLPIESIKDLYEFKKYGRPKKGRFSDMVAVGELKRKGAQLYEQSIPIAHASKMAIFDILQANCNALLNLMEEDEVSSNSLRSSVGAERQVTDEQDEEEFC